MGIALHPRPTAMQSPPHAAGWGVSRRTAARWLLAAATLGAGVIHLAVAGEHLQEYRPLGIAMIASGVFQVGWAGVTAVSHRRGVLLLAGLASSLFVAVYVMSRVVGLPSGPEAFVPEPLGSTDLICCGLEVVVAVGALLLARRPAMGRRALGRGWAASCAASLVLVSAASTLALTSSGHEHAPGTHASCPSAPVPTGTLDERGVDTGVTAYFRCLLTHEHDATSHAHG